MKILFVFLSSDRPSGDVRIQYEIANGLAGQGDEVHIAHYPWPGLPALSPEDVAWFPFDASVVHHFDAQSWDDDFRADVAFGPPAEERGLPALVWSVYEMMSEEDLTYNCPKVCMSRFLVGQGRLHGVPEAQLHPFRPSIDHECFAILRGLGDRPRGVAMHWSVLPGGRSDVGLAVLEDVHRRLPDAEFRVFGVPPRPADLPSWAAYLEAPDAHVVADDVYNSSSVFLSTADLEGVAWSSMEAMACGCALVTTESGGSADVAVDEETALVSKRGDVASLADDVVTLLQDDRRRIELATAGAEFVHPFEWVNNARRLHGYLERYRARPEVFRRRPHRRRSA